MNKKLTLGVAATLLVAGSQAQAAGCPDVATVTEVTATGFSCTEGDKTFSAFTIADAPTQASVLFEPVGTSMFLVSLSRGGGLFAPGDVLFNYTVTAAEPAKIVMGTVGVDVPTVSPPIVTSSSMNGMTLEPSPLSNSGTASVSFSPGVSSVGVVNSSNVLSGDVLTSISNTFTQTSRSVPEPASLSLFGLGLAGLWFARRRRPGGRERLN